MVGSCLKRVEPCFKSFGRVIKRLFGTLFEMCLKRAEQFVDTLLKRFVCKHIVIRPAEAR